MDEADSADLALFVVYIYCMRLLHVFVFYDRYYLAERRAAN